MFFIQRRAPQAEHNRLVYPEGVLTLNTDLSMIHVHDGETPGGRPISFPIRVTGPLSLEPGGTGSYTIEDFDSFSTYSVTSAGGNVTLDGETITFEPTETGENNGFVVMRDGVGRSFTVPVVSPMLGGTFTQKTAGPDTRNLHTAVTIADKMYVFGGELNNSVGYDDKLWVYNPSDDTWTEKASGTYGRVEHSAVAYGGKMYVIGGRTADGAVMDPQVYDPEEDTWTTLTDEYGSRRRHACAVVDETIYVFGGEDGHSRKYPGLLAYDIQADTWSEKTYQPVSRENHTAVVIEGDVYVFGGIDVTTVHNDLWRYRPSDDTWTELSSGPGNRHSHTASVVDGKMYVFGGLNAESNADENQCDDLWVYSPDTDGWTVIGTGATPRFEHSASVIGEAIYIHGGYTPDWLVDDLWAIT